MFETQKSGKTGVEFAFASAFNVVMVAMIDGTTGSLPDMMATLTALIPVCFPGNLHSSILTSDFAFID